MKTISRKTVKRRISTEDYIRITKEFSNREFLWKFFLCVSLSMNIIVLLWYSHLNFMIVKDHNLTQVKSDSINQTIDTEVKVKDQTIKNIAPPKPTSTPSVSPSKNTLEKTATAKTISNVRLARITAYWPDVGDYYTSHNLSATGVHLRHGHCAVDPNIIPYGSIVEIQNVGTFVAVDTGSAVITRKAAKESGHTTAQRNALVVDLYFESERAGQHFADNGPKFATVSWHSPHDVALNKNLDTLVVDNE